MKLIQAPPGSPRGAFSFVGRSSPIYWLCPTGCAPTTYNSPGSWTGLLRLPSRYQQSGDGTHPAGPDQAL